MRNVTNRWTQIGYFSSHIRAPFYNFQSFFEWYEGATVFRVFILFYFIFVCRTNGKKEHLCENNFCYFYGNYSESAILKVTWSQPSSKFLLNNYDDNYTDNDIWETSYNWRFYGHGLTYLLILSWLNIMKRKLTKPPGKLSVPEKFKPVLQRT